MANANDADGRHMRAALGLARRGLGNVWPNPAVGCVVVRDGRVVGRGWTQPRGRPHAEAEALRRAGAAAHGATAYVSLEPCNHTGQTPPCTEALIAAELSRAVIALEDPDARVSGKGIAKLREAGMRVDLGVCAAEAVELNAGYLMRVVEGRPLVTLKFGTTLDGCIATHKGESRWITGETARTIAHGLRANHDAVMVGIGTALVDDPLLTCRLPGLGRATPVRIVVDSRLRLPLTSQLVVTAPEVPTWLITLREGSEERRQAYADCGVELVEVDAGPDGLLDMRWVMTELGARGLTRVLVEGGSNLAATLLRRDLADRLVWFRAPRLIGGDGIPAAAALGLESLDDMPAFTRLSVREVGEDLLETYIRRG